MTGGGRRTTDGLTEYERAVAQAERRAAARITPPSSPHEIVPPTLEQMLAFENAAHRSKEAEIRTTFNMSATRYYQYLNRAIDTPEALAADPQLIKRLLNQRARATRARASRTITPK